MGQAGGVGRAGCGARCEAAFSLGKIHLMNAPLVTLLRISKSQLFHNPKYPNAHRRSCKRCNRGPPHLFKRKSFNIV